MQESKIDNVVNELIDTVADHRGRGFVLDLAADQREKLNEARDHLLHMVASGKNDAAKILQITDNALNALDGTSIAVTETLPPIDDYISLAEGRKHVIHDTHSFINYAKKYGNADKTLIFYDQKGATITLDEMIERGEREIVNMTFTPTDEWAAWSGMIATTVSHKSLFRHCMLHAHTLENPDILNSLRKVKTNSTVNTESNIQDDSKTFGVLITTNGGEELAKFPKEIKLRVPILEQDLSDSSIWADATLRLEIELPDDPKKGGVMFTLHCSGWNLLMRRRTQDEAEFISKELDGYLVLRGHQETFKRKVGRNS